MSGAGPAAFASLDMQVHLGVKPANIYGCDSKGLIYAGRDALVDASKARSMRKPIAARAAWPT
ncbi:MAG: NADP-dependent malic enzyme [Massilia sp.]|nr:NADP-dependent malic enzyme [Massilia sp.]